MTRSDYEERREARIERFQDLAVKKAAESETLFQRAHDSIAMIPPGQPILVGHHSEKRHRAALDRHDNLMRKACGTSDTAEYYERKAAGAINNNAISSDDPEALDKLREKLKDLQESTELMKAINKIIRSKKIQPAERAGHYRALALSEEMIAHLEHPAQFQRIKLPGGAEFFDTDGFPSFALTNNSGNIRRVKQRIEQMEQEARDVTTEQEIGDIRIINSVEENRIMITFPYKPDDGARAMLKSSGFRWSPSNGAWQAYRSAAWQIPHIIKRLTVMPAYVGLSTIPVLESMEETP